MPQHISPSPSTNDVVHCATTDPGAARQWLARQYTTHELTFSDAPSAFDFLHISAPLREGSANFLRYGSEVQVQPGAFPGFTCWKCPSPPVSPSACRAKATAPPLRQLRCFCPPTARSPRFGGR